MKVDNVVSHDLIKKIETGNDSLGINKQEKEKEIKEDQGVSVELSLEGLKRVREEDLINNPTLSSLSFKEDNRGNSFVQIIEKETGEVIRQMPTEEAIEQYDRIQNFLDRLKVDLIV